MVEHWHNVYKISSTTSPIEKTPPTGSDPLALDDDDDDKDATEEVVLSSKRLSLLSGNLPIENEPVLRNFLTPRINKLTEGGTTATHNNSTITSIEDLMPDVSTQVIHRYVKGYLGRKQEEETE